MHVINFSNDKKVVKIGRANDCDTRIIDISVSRHHSMIRKEIDNSQSGPNKTQIWICDDNSKFGTLLHHSKPVQLKLNQPQYVQ